MKPILILLFLALTSFEISAQRLNLNGLQTFVRLAKVSSLSPAAHSGIGLGFASYAKFQQQWAFAPSLDLTRFSLHKGGSGYSYAYRIYHTHLNADFAFEPKGVDAQSFSNFAFLAGVGVSRFLGHTKKLKAGRAVTSDGFLDRQQKTRLHLNFGLCWGKKRKKGHFLLFKPEFSYNIFQQKIVNPNRDWSLRMGLIWLWDKQPESK